MNESGYSYKLNNDDFICTLPGPNTNVGDGISYSYTLLKDNLGYAYYGAILDYNLLSTGYALYAYCYTYSGSDIQYESDLFSPDSNITTYGTLSLKQFQNTSTGYTVCRYCLTYDNTKWLYSPSIQLRPEVKQSNDESNISTAALNIETDLEGNIGILTKKYTTYVKYGTKYNYFNFNQKSSSTTYNVSYIHIYYNTFSYSNLYSNYTVKYNVIVTGKSWNSSDLDTVIRIKDTVVGEYMDGSEYNIPYEITLSYLEGQGGNLKFSSFGFNTNNYNYILSYTNPYPVTRMISSAGCGANPVVTSNNPLKLLNNNIYYTVVHTDSTLLGMFTFEYVDYIANDKVNFRCGGVLPCDVYVTVSATTITGTSITLGSATIKQGTTGTFSVPVTDSSAILKNNPYISSFSPSSYYTPSDNITWSFKMAL